MKKLLLFFFCLVAFTIAKADEAVFTFTEPTGLTPSVTPSETASDGVSINDVEFTSGEATFVATKGSTTDARIWTGTKGYELRVYTGGTMTVSVPEGYFITTINFTGGKIKTFAPAEGTYASGEWSGKSSSVLFNVTGTLNINTITVTYISEEAAAKTVAVPVIAPESGDITADTEISISCETEGATIYYTTDGTEPSKESSVYNAPFTVSGDATVKAFAVLDGFTDSEVAVAEYEIPVLAKYGYVKSITSGKTYLLYNDGRAINGVLNNGAYGYMQTDEVAEEEGYINADVDCALTFTAVEGGYTIQNAAGEYLYQKGTYDNFNKSTDANVEGAVWTVELQDNGTFKITNVLKEKYIQFESSYKNYGSYATAKGLLPYLYEAGATSVEVPVEELDVAENILSFYELTEGGAKAIIGFDLTVIAVAGSNVFVTDGTNFSCLYANNHNLKAQDVVKSGWTATYGNYKGLHELCPVDVAELTTTGAVATLPEPRDVKAADLVTELQSVYVRIVDVEVEPLATGNFTGKDVDGGDIKFYNKFSIEVPETGLAKYDILGVVNVYGEDIQVYPLSYTCKSETAIEGVEDETVSAEYYNLLGVKVSNLESGVYLKKQGDKVVKVYVK